MTRAGAIAAHPQAVRDLLVGRRCRGSDRVRRPLAVGVECGAVGVGLGVGILVSVDDVDLPSARGVHLGEVGAIEAGDDRHRGVRHLERPGVVVDEAPVQSVAGEGQAIGRGGVDAPGAVLGRGARVQPVLLVADLPVVHAVGGGVAVGRPQLGPLPHRGPVGQGLGGRRRTVHVGDPVLGLGDGAGLDVGLDHRDGAGAGDGLHLVHPLVGAELEGADVGVDPGGSGRGRHPVVGAVDVRAVLEVHGRVHADEVQTERGGGSGD